MSSMLGGYHASPPNEQSSWISTDHAPSTYAGHETPSGNGDQNMMGLSFLKLGGSQKRVTRDGQPPKRRGPKPDSKPAQTRRQELNRQAQRTHRERKEQYIKALEIELARVREAFVEDAKLMSADLDQHRLALQEQQQDNRILRDILMSRGISFEKELNSRRAAFGMHARQHPTSAGPSPVTHRQASFQSTVPTMSPPSGYRMMHDHGIPNGAASSITGSHSSHTPRTHTATPNSPMIEEYAIKRESEPVQDTPGNIAGIFEKDPQLGIEFILALEATCRDHGEYLVRKSYDSADTEEDAQFSGHALMASCPPPSHISTTPPQMGGFQPTYPHQVPELPSLHLNVLLNLSQQIKAAGYVEGGQVTPIMALQSLRGHRNYHALTRSDVLVMIETIRNKVRCYGFGAVMEDFELRDALSSTFATKPEAYEGLPEIDEMYS